MFEPEEETVVVKRGCLVRVVEYKTIKLITTLLAIMLFTEMLFSCKLFMTSIHIRSHIGYFINMISEGDGDTLPSLQAIPVLLFLVINVIMAVTVYMSFDDFERSELNRVMFVVVIFSFLLLIGILIIVICVITHAYGSHQKLHLGIVAAMNRYSNSTVYKAQIDHLQVEFQCCGSKKYDEWYDIKWMDPSLEQGSGSVADGNTPFSCCSMKSLSPCIHHNIEVTGKAYLYTPEFNLSVSTRGCYEIIRERKQQVGWAIVSNMLLYFLFEAVTVILFRFIQTGHFGMMKFSGRSRRYTIWLFGSYVGKIKSGSKKDPLIPDELKE